MTADALRLGERVRTLGGGTATVVAARVVPGAADMWDLTVSNVHTFAVGGGGYVVHNCSGTGRRGDDGTDSWGRPETLQDHFDRHGKDVGATSPTDYAQKASDFLKGSQARGQPTKIDPTDGAIRVYDPETNTFASYNANGTTRTIFKPKLGLDYWLDQPGNDPYLFW